MQTTILLLAIMVTGDARVTHVLTGMVVSVADGDTLTVLDSDNVQHKVRLNSIDAPERNQPFSVKSKRFLSDAVFGRDVSVQWKRRDRYGRILGDVRIDGRNINLELVENGWAWHFMRYDHSKTFADAETLAREKRLGLWADGNAIPPWEFRVKKRTPND